MLAAARQHESAAQKRLMDRLANGKRFEFQKKDPSDADALGQDTISSARSRVARKPLQLRAKQELDATTWSHRGRRGIPRCEGLIARCWSAK